MLSAQTGSLRKNLILLRMLRWRRVAVRSMERECMSRSRRNDRGRDLALMGSARCLADVYTRKCRENLFDQLNSNLQ